MRRMNSELVVRLEVRGRQASLELLAEDMALARARWEDRRDLSERFFVQLERLLRRCGRTRSAVARYEFDCDSPYFGRPQAALALEELDSTGRCGFTAWQAGETLARVLNFARQLK